VAYSVKLDFSNVLNAPRGRLDTAVPKGQACDAEDGRAIDAERHQWTIELSASQDIIGN